MGNVRLIIKNECLHISNNLYNCIYGQRGENPARYTYLLYCTFSLGRNPFFWLVREVVFTDAMSAEFRVYEKKVTNIETNLLCQFLKRCS